MNTSKSFRVSSKRTIGAGHPIYVIAEIGINHNGSLDIAKKLIDEAVLHEVAVRHEGDALEAEVGPERREVSEEVGGEEPAEAEPLEVRAPDLPRGHTRR